MNGSFDNDDSLVIPTPRITDNWRDPPGYYRSLSESGLERAVGRSGGRAVGPKSATTLRHVLLSAITTPRSFLVSPASSSSSVTESRFGRPDLRFPFDGAIEVTVLLAVR